MATDIKYDFERFDGRTGQPYRKWRDSLLNFCATKFDESGSTYADYLVDRDMGGTDPAAPALPAANAANNDRAKMQRLRLARQKGSYGIIIKHISDPDLVTILTSQFFQHGSNALDYLDLHYDTPISNSELKEMTQRWNDLSILEEVGIKKDSIIKFVQLLQSLNSERPAAHRFNSTQMTEKLLESIARASRHFQESSMREHDAQPAQWEFVVPAGLVGAGRQRDFNACAAYYNTMWASALKTGAIAKAEPTKKPSLHSAKAADEGGLVNQVGSHRPAPKLQVRTATAFAQMRQADRYMR